MYFPRGFPTLLLGTDSSTFSRVDCLSSIQSPCFRPIEFLTEKDAKNSSQIDDDMLPPSESDSDEDGDLPLTGLGNPNRAPPAAADSSDSSDSSENEQD